LPAVGAGKYKKGMHMAAKKKAAKKSKKVKKVKRSNKKGGPKGRGTGPG